MYKILIIEVVIYIIGFVLCLKSLFSTEWFNLSSFIFIKKNISGVSIGLFTECTRFVNGTNKCSIYSCSNSTDTKDFCVDIVECIFGLFISAVAFLILNIFSLVRGILICYSQGWREGICTRINISACGIVALIGTALGVGYGSHSMPDLLKSLPPGVVAYTIGSGYSMVIVAFSCALICLILQCISCYNRWMQSNQQQIIYQYLPQPTEPQYNNPLFQGNIYSQPPPIYSSKA
jgi:hypothetical protein